MINNQTPETMTEIKIEKNVPLPENRGLNKYKKLLDSLKVGDSFVFPANKMPGMRNYIYSVRNRLGEKYITRKIDKDSFRIWRSKWSNH